MSSRLISHNHKKIRGLKWLTNESFIQSLGVGSQTKYKSCQKTDL